MAINKIKDCFKKNTVFVIKKTWHTNLHDCKCLIFVLIFGLPLKERFKIISVLITELEPHTGERKNCVQPERESMNQGWPSFVRLLVRISQPMSVTRKVCSNCADLLPSCVTAVQLSGQVESRHVPANRNKLYQLINRNQPCKHPR